jgi:hypothetical protein
MDDPKGDRLSQALTPMTQALAADGYHLKLDVSEESILVSIEAGPDACADCLIPKDLMLDMLRTRLEDEGLLSSDLPIHLSYPSEVS